MINAVNEFMDDMRGGKMTDAPIVEVEQGKLQGRIVGSPSGKAYYSFQGIPYAKPPLGSLRFKAPQSAEPWEGVRDATSEGNISAQIDPLVHKTYMGDENCLFLNVYTTNLDGEFLPVMVYIHGGGFRFGSGSSSFYGGDYLVQKDVVVVTINYRCGALGFLSLNTPDIPGNAGLKDIVQAIRWVKDNIKSFGGNSGNITLFGESAGGVATTILTASPLTKDLLSKAIVQSGNALNSWGWQKTPLENARTLAKFLGSEAEDIDEILDFLLATSARDIVEATEKFNPTENFYENGLGFFGPVVEKEFSGVEAVITESFLDILNSGRTAQIPIMIGSNTLEFTYERTNEDLQIFIPNDLNIGKNTPEAVAIANSIKSLYFKDKPIGVESLKEYFELLSDKLINIDTNRYVQYLVKVSNKPIYYYKFDYVGELNLTKKLFASLGLTRAGHLDELGYLFKNDVLNDVEPTSQDIKMRERMLGIWTNFAKSGNPTPEENYHINITWVPVSKDNLYYLNLGTELSLKTNPDKEKMEFWDELYKKHFKIWEHPQTNTEEEPKTETKMIVEEKEVLRTNEDDTPRIVQETTITVVESVIGTDEIVNIEKSTLIKDEQDILAVEENARNASHVEEEPVKVERVEENGVLEHAVEEIKNEIEPLKIDTSPLMETPIIKEAELLKEKSIIDERPELQKEVKLNGNKELNGVNGNGITTELKPARASNEIKMVQQSNGGPKDIIRANDPPEDDLPKNIGVNKFVNFFESLGKK